MVVCVCRSVMLSDGKAPTSPMTGMVLRSTELRSNYLARSLVQSRMRATAATGAKGGGAQGV